MTETDLFFHGWTNIWRTIVIGSLAYVALVLFLRVSGKRTLTKLNAFDLVITVSLGSTLSAVLLQSSIPLAEGITALALLIAMQYVVTYMSVRSAFFAKMVRSEPALLVRDGVFCDSQMRQSRITQDEALSAIRKTGGRTVADVEMMILESDGSISVGLK